jgi:hypothetical protein
LLTFELAQRYTQFLFSIENDMSKIIDELVVLLQNGVTWIDQNYVNIDLPVDDERAHVAAGCFDIAIEFQASILLLCKAERFALCFAAQRLIFEALVRGIWIKDCAEEKQFEAFKNGHGPRKLEPMTAAINKKFGDDVLHLDRYRDQLEGHLHDFAHTGYQHIARRYTDDTLGPNYSEREICIVINLTYLMGMQAAARIAVLSGNPKLATATYEQMARYGEAYAQLRKSVP